MKDYGYHSLVLPIAVTVVLTFVLLSVLAGAVESYRNSTSDPDRAPGPNSSSQSAQFMSHLVNDASAVKGVA